MKAIKYLFILGISLFATTACMNDFDDPTFSVPPIGNNNIGEATITIKELKENYASTIKSNGYKQFTEETIIEGVVVANDLTGNVYKQLVINDATGAIIIGVDDVGLYATLPVGQHIRINCKDLYIGGYGSLAQIGTKYYNSKYSEYQIGRMSKKEFREHMRIMGEPNLSHEWLVPFEVTEEFLANKANKELTPIYVVLRNVSFNEADGERLFAPEEEQISETNTAVERTINIGKQKIIFRMSTYADFANTAIPTGNHDIYGVLTRYRNPGSNSDSKDYWQFMLTSTDDIKSVE